LFITKELAKEITSNNDTSTIYCSLTLSRKKIRHSKLYACYMGK